MAGVVLATTLFLTLGSTISLCIRECGSTLYVGLVHAAPPTQYKAFTTFSTNWLSEGSALRYTCKKQQISSLG